MGEQSNIKIEKDYPVIWVIIDREKYANALGSKDLRDLKEALEASCEDANATAVAITGRGERYFSSGVDLNEIASIQDVESAWDYLYRGLGDVIRSMLECRIPVIAAVNGYAIGAGFDLIYAADLAYAVRSAKLGVTAVKWGLIPPITSTIGLLLANSKAVSLLALTGDLISAEEAAKYGFVNDVVDNVDALKFKIKEVATKMSNNDRLALEQIKSLISLAKLNPYIYAGMSTIAAFAARKGTRERILSSFRK